MDLIVAGSRTGADYKIVSDCLDTLSISTIISGGARGADSFAKRYAIENGISYKEYLPRWDKYGMRAGWLRNNQMADNHLDATVIIFWDGQSRGTAHWFNITKERNMRLLVKRL